MKFNVTTNQEAFDKVVAHLKTAQRRSMSDAVSCAYRGKDGAMCAVGVLLDDFDENDIMVNNASPIGALPVEIPDGLSVRMLDDLQHAHDSSFNWGAGGFWAAGALRDIARDHHLDPSVVALVFG